MFPFHMYSVILTLTFLKLFSRWLKIRTFQNKNIE